MATWVRFIVCCVLCVVCCVLFVVCLRNPTEYRGIEYGRPSFGKYSTRLVQYMATTEKSAKLTVHPRQAGTLHRYLQGIRSSSSTSSRGKTLDGGPRANPATRWDPRPFDPIPRFSLCCEQNM